MDEEYWKTARSRQRSAQGSGKTGVLNIALLFGTAAIALSLIITPMLAERVDERRLTLVPDKFDQITTGSIGRAQGTSRNYTIRRSILQEEPGSLCIVQGYGADSQC